MDILVTSNENIKPRLLIAMEFILMNFQAQNLLNYYFVINLHIKFMDAINEMLFADK